MTPLSTDLVGAVWTAGHTQCIVLVPGVTNEARTMSISELTSPLPTVLTPASWLGRPPAHSVRVARGSYLLPTAGPPTWRQLREVSLARLIAVVHAYPSILALSHESAAMLHGGTLASQEPDVHAVQRTHQHHSTLDLPRVLVGASLVTALPAAGSRAQPGARSGRQVRLRRHVRSGTDLGEITTIHGLPVTSIRTTLIDCLTDLDPHDSLVIGDSLARIMVDADRFLPEQARERWETVRAELGEQIKKLRRRRGRQRALRVLRLLDPLSESWGESRLRFILLAAGAPEPIAQTRVDAGGCQYFIDLVIPGLRLAIEFDGRGKYTGPDTVYEEKKRQDALIRQGWDIMRVRTEDLRDPQRIVEEVMRRVPRGHYLALRPRPWLGTIS
ncbi:endonuclease domain-containing protein [Actinomyces faecalis]|uniref:endonuclease domain-containing protein n=1 Tax=Actinomyces faecalis TaxID=2722820 RepID=UPI0015579C59|nr:DUF559 domain-containing protein [Actinomyces faecalis]